MDRPKLRRLERYRLRRDDGELVVLRDPMDLVEPIAVDVAYGPVLDALDGTRTVPQIRQSLLMRGVVDVDGDDLLEFVDELGAAGLLDDDRFRARWADVHDEFMASPERLPRRAGLLYPDDPDQLHAWLAPALPKEVQNGPTSRPPVIGLLAPHQPPPSVATLLRPLLAALPDPEQYERVVVLATDHTPGLLPYALTDKDQQTVLGPLRCDLELIEAIEERVPWILREQVRHRSADAIEWATLLLRALWGDRCPPVVPILCGQTRLTSADGRARADELIAQLELLLGSANDRSKVLWWTAAELTHRGPAFGHAELPSREEVLERDQALLDPLLARRPELLVRRCMDADPVDRPSGTAALATLVDLLPLEHRAELVEHTVLPAPGELPGWIGCAGVLFRAR